MHEKLLQQLKHHHTTPIPTPTHPLYHTAPHAEPPTICRLR